LAVVQAASGLLIGQQHIRRSYELCAFVVCADAGVHCVRNLREHLFLYAGSWIIPPEVGVTIRLLKRDGGVHVLIKRQGQPDYLWSIEQYLWRGIEFGCDLYVFADVLCLPVLVV
jgi:hypothetical protein